MQTFDQVKNHRDVILKQSKRYPELWVAKYHRRCFYKNRWDAVTKECRGHVWHADTATMVINAPTKLFNYMENGTTIHRDEKCIAVQKINGFMACVTWIPEVNDMVISTTGSLDSDFVGYAERYLRNLSVKHMFSEYDGYTLFFEICHPDDPHIIPEKEGAYLLGMRRVDDTGSYKTDEHKEELLDSLAVVYSFHRPDWFIAKFGNISEWLKTCKHEGFVVYGQNTSLKMKSPYYLVQKMMARKEDILSLDRKKIPEEYYPMINHFNSDAENFNALDEQIRLQLMREYLEEQ